MAKYATGKLFDNCVFLDGNESPIKPRNNQSCKGLKTLSMIRNSMANTNNPNAIDKVNNKGNYRNTITASNPDALYKSSRIISSKFKYINPTSSTSPSNKNSLRNSNKNSLRNSTKNCKNNNNNEVPNLMIRPATSFAKNVKIKYYKMFAQTEAVKKRLKGRLINLVNKNNLVSLKDLNSEVKYTKN